MKTIAKSLVNADSCRAALAKCWGDQLRIEPATDGFFLALPLMYPDGMQVVIQLTPVSDRAAILSDRGETLARLGTSGVDLTQPRNAEFLNEKLKMFEMQRDGLDLQKAIHLPVDGIDVHLFGEALVSISHLIYRHELASPRAQYVYTAVQGLLRRKCLTFKEGEDAYVLGRVEQRIGVDFLVTDKRVIACKTVERRGRMRDYIEQWGYRWMDARQHNRKLVRAMFYDPENQQWDDHSQRIANDVCEIFQPYFETDKISAALDSYREAA